MFRGRQRSAPSGDRYRLTLSAAMVDSRIQILLNVEVFFPRVALLDQVYHPVGVRLRAFRQQQPAGDDGNDRWNADKNQTRPAAQRSLNESAWVNSGNAFAEFMRKPIWAAA